MKALGIFTLLLTLSLPVSAQETNKVEGLTMPPDATVSVSEGYVTITASPADSNGLVKFLVLGTDPVKSTTFGNTVVVSIPPVPESVITIYGVTVLANGKLSDFARTQITVGKAAPDKPVKPVTQPLGKLFITAVYAAGTSPPAYLQSPSLLAALKASGHAIRVLAANDPQLKSSNLLVAIQGTSLPSMILQTSDGKVQPSKVGLPLPADEASFLSQIKQLSGL